MALVPKTRSVTQDVVAKQAIVALGLTFAVIAFVSRIATLRQSVENMLRWSIKRAL